MSATEDDTAVDALDAEGGAAEASAEKQRLALDVKIDPRGACQRHITVIVARDDIDRYFNNAFSELMEKSAVPGFRQGRAPRKLVESRYRKDVVDQVKGSLILDSMAQVTEDHKLAAISEPDIDPVAIVVPEEGPMTYEFDLEVRPEFELPDWKGLSVERPVREITEQDVDDHLKSRLATRGRLVPFDGPAARGDYLAVNVTFRHGETLVKTLTDQVLQLQPVLSLRDGRITSFGKTLTGAKAGDRRTCTFTIREASPNAALRGQEVAADFEVLDVKKRELPDLTPDVLDEIGEFETVEEMRTSVRSALERQVQYDQYQRTRQQVLNRLIVAADWELPPEMLRRQTQRELNRAVLELRSSGFTDSAIRARENELRQNSSESTAKALKEHFILERIAEEEKIDADEADYDYETMMIAAQSGESVRRVRAQLEKQGLMDAVRNQIVERKVIGLVLEHAKFKDVPFEFETSDVEALNQSAAGGEEEEAIPEARHSQGPASGLPGQNPREKTRV